MKQVYISHAASDADSALKIANYLENRGISCFIASRDIQPDCTYASALTSALEECELFLLLMTRTANRSEFIKRELDIAVNRKKKILPIIAEDFEMDDIFRFYIGRNQWVIAYPDAIDTFLEHIYDTVKPLVTAVPVKETQAPPAQPARYSFDENRPYVFISYAHKDNETVLPIIEGMKAQNINLWYDNGIEAGSEWPQYIAEKILKCDRFICLISNSYLASQNCKRELNYAISHDKQLLSIHMEKVELPAGIDMQLGSYQAMFYDRFNGRQHFVDTLCREKFLYSCRVTPIKQDAPKPAAPKPAAPKPAAPKPTTPKPATPKPATTPKPDTDTEQKSGSFFTKLLAVAALIVLVYYLIPVMSGYPYAIPSYKYAYTVSMCLAGIGLLFRLIIVAVWADKNIFKKVLFILVSSASVLLAGHFCCLLIMKISFLYYVLAFLAVLLAHAIMELLLFFVAVFLDT